MEHKATNFPGVLELKHAALDSVNLRQEENVEARASSKKPHPMPGCRGRSRNKRFLGVRQRPSGRWVAEIKDTTQKIRLWLGTFDCAEDAARAYDEAACMLRGSNTRTNFMPAASSSPGHFSLLPSKPARLLLHRRSSAAAAKLESAEEADAATATPDVAATSATSGASKVGASETDDSLTSCRAFEPILPTANSLQGVITLGDSETVHSAPSCRAFDFAPTPLQLPTCMVSSQDLGEEDVEQVVVAGEREYRSNSSGGTDMISDSACSYSITQESLTLFPEMDHKEWLEAFDGTEQQYLEGAMMSDCGCSSYRSTDESLISLPEIPGNRNWLEHIRRERQYLETKPLEDDDETSTDFVAAEDSSDDLHYYTSSFDFSAADLEPLEKVPDTSSLEDPALSDDTMLLNEHFLRMKVQCSTPLSVCIPNVFQECLLLSSSFPAGEQGVVESSSHDQLIWNSWDLAPLCLVS